MSNDQSAWPQCFACDGNHNPESPCKWRPQSHATVSNNTVMTDAAQRATKATDGGKEKSDGLTAHYYELPEAATELYHLITYKNMNAQIGEIFRACYRYGEVEHSAKLRDVNKMLAYATQEKERLLKYELSNNEE